MISVGAVCREYPSVLIIIFAVISGHKDYNSLYAANDTVQEKFTVNILGAPNNSTTTVSRGKG